jgi:hypothetical protein
MAGKTSNTHLGFPCQRAPALQSPKKARGEYATKDESARDEVDTYVQYGNFALYSEGAGTKVG